MFPYTCISPIDRSTKTPTVHNHRAHQINLYGYLVNSLDSGCSCGVRNITVDLDQEYTGLSDLIVSRLLTSPAQFHITVTSNGCDGVSNHQLHHYLLNLLFRSRSKKTSKLRVTGLCVGNSLVTGEFPAQMASNTKNVSIWWRHQESTRIHVFGYADKLSVSINTT